jgi:hypothetical protein
MNVYRAIWLFFKIILKLLSSCLQNRASACIPGKMGAWKFSANVSYWLPNRSSPKPAEVQNRLRPAPRVHMKSQEQMSHFA